MSNFKDLLAKPAEAFKAPLAQPAGTYVGMITKFEYGESRNKKTPYVRFSIRPMMAETDVDQEQLAEFGPIGKEMNLDYYLTDDAVYRLSEFIEKTGGNTKLPLQESIEVAVNKNIRFSVTHRMDKDRTFAEVSQILGVVE